MNILSIDSSLANKVVVTFKTTEKEFIKESEQKFGSQALLSLIQEILKAAELELKDITEIKVATGPGSYTGLKVGAAVANALGFALGIPVNGKKMVTDLTY
jgi:tRNA threonylcarbamoyladenosine biosynthesis protein TsaB